MTTELKDGQIVITSTLDLSKYVAQKTQELTILQQQIDSIIKRQQSIISEMESLLPKDEE